MTTGDDPSEITVDDARGILSYSRESAERLVGAYGQDQEIIEWAERNGFEVVGFCRDIKVHGQTPATDRPGLSAAIDAVAEGRVAGVAIHRLDRLSRDFSTQDDAIRRIWDAGGRVFSCEPDYEWRPDRPGDAQWRLRRDYAHMAEDELHALLARLQGGRRRKMARGGYGGGCRLARRYGMELIEIQGKLEYRPVPAEQAVIRRVAAMSAAGTSYRSIARTLNVEGVPTVTGAKWSHIVVRELVRRGPDRLVVIPPETGALTPVQWVQWIKREAIGA